MSVGEPTDDDFDARSSELKLRFLEFRRGSVDRAIPSIVERDLERVGRRLQTGGESDSIAMDEAPNSGSSEVNESEKPDEPMEIKIDSPTTVTHHHTTPPPPQTSTLAKLAMAGVAAAGLGSGIGIPLAVMSYMSNKPVPVVEAQSDTDTKYGLKIYRPSEAEEKP
jgi:hypothetical protein